MSCVKAIPSTLPLPPPPPPPPRSLSPPLPPPSSPSSTLRRKNPATEERHAHDMPHATPILSFQVNLLPEYRSKQKSEI